MKYSMNITFTLITYLGLFTTIIIGFITLLTESTPIMKTSATIGLPLALISIFIVYDMHIVIENEYVGFNSGLLKRKYRYENILSVHGINSNWDQLLYVNKSGKKGVFLSVAFVKNKSEFNTNLKAALTKHGIPFD